MKKNILIIMAIGILGSCQEEGEINPLQLNLSNAPEILEQMYLEGFIIAVQSLDQTRIEGKGNAMFLDNRLLKSKTFRHLEKNYFQTENSNFEALLSENSGAQNYFDANFDPNSPEFLEILENSYSSEQLSVLKEFFDELFVTEEYGKVKMLARNFQRNVNGYILSEEEKLELISVGAGIYAFADFLEKGGMELVGEKLSVLGRESGHSYNLRCNVSSRSVWGGAVIGFSLGGVRGGMIGCAGGTIIFPGLGTATGCVGGAVFGAALGFIEGAATGIAGSLLLSCFR